MDGKKSAPRDKDRKDPYKENHEGVAFDKDELEDVTGGVNPMSGDYSGMDFCKLCNAYHRPNQHILMIR